MSASQSCEKERNFQTKHLTGKAVVIIRSSCCVMCGHSDVRDCSAKNASSSILLVPAAIIIASCLFHLLRHLHVQHCRTGQRLRQSHDIEAHSLSISRRITTCTGSLGFIHVSRRIQCMMCPMISGIFLCLFSCVFLCFLVLSVFFIVTTNKCYISTFY